MVPSFGDDARLTTPFVCRIDAFLGWHARYGSWTTDRAIGITMATDTIMVVIHWQSIHAVAAELLLITGLKVSHVSTE